MDAGPGPRDLLALPGERGPRALFSFPRSMRHRAGPEHGACARKEGQERASREGAPALGESRASFPGPLPACSAQERCAGRLLGPQEDLAITICTEVEGFSRHLRAGISRPSDTDVDIWLQKMSCSSFQECLLGGGRGGGRRRSLKIIPI